MADNLNSGLDRSVSSDDTRFVMRWTCYSDYMTCPRYYQWAWGHSGVDFGNGEGAPHTPTSQKSNHDAALGTAIGYAVEIFYNENLWEKLTVDELKIYMKHLAVKKLEEECSKNYIDWMVSPSVSELVIICEDGVLGFLKTLKHQRLLSRKSRSEVVKYSLINDEFYIRGTLDILIEDAEGKITILDGKNTKFKSTYLKKEQLLYYALCLYRETLSLPDRIGWLYYRFPYDKDLGGENEGVEWITYNQLDLEILLSNIIAVWENIKASNFEPTPSSNACKFCKFSNICDRKYIPKTRKSKSSNMEHHDVPYDEVGGRKIVRFE